MKHVELAKASFGVGLRARIVVDVW
jgi:hypothetical protein